jgi:hypothetical protein
LAAFTSFEVFNEQGGLALIGVIVESDPAFILSAAMR